MDTSAPIAVSPLLHADKSAPDTPALLVDLDALEANIATIADGLSPQRHQLAPAHQGHQGPADRRAS